MSKNKTPVLPVIMAGGSGTRLWPLSRAGYPKQFLVLSGSQSLFQQAVARLQDLADETLAVQRPLVVGNEDHRFLVLDQLDAIKAPPAAVILEPAGRNTAPAVTLAALQAREAEGADADPVLVVTPADQTVTQAQAFTAAMRRAVAVAAGGGIAILGVVPDRPETGYGYILPAGAAGMGEGIFNVEAFTEKPDLPAAGAIIARGGVWNTFVMVFRLSRMMELLARFAPEGFGPMLALRDAPEKAADIYASLRAWNFSTHFLARIPRHLLVVEVTGVGWSDWGTRESIERTYRTLKLVPFWNRSRAVSHQAAG